MTETIEAAVIRRGGGCPMVEFFHHIGGKWSFPILYVLYRAEAPLRFGELRRRLEPVTQKELTRHLRAFERLGLVSRGILCSQPLQVEYALTEYGRTLEAPLNAVAAWVLHHGGPLFRSES
ncbi:MAG TPA: helix-turn-helix domain-containing protein [Phenylobacterium sp.]|nr:helix-turn-helix domain-containing protein [Phenylobacterium sp.]HKT53738.1 helix-turn-helix domain-containing protein [Caulobacteraceae bacterium]